MSRDVLKLAIMVSDYINNNFMESDFFTLGNVEPEEFSKFLLLLKNTQNVTRTDNSPLTLLLDGNYYNRLETVLWYGRNFGDDIKELEAVHDDLYEIYDGFWDALTFWGALMSCDEMSKNNQINIELDQTKLDLIITGFDEILKKPDCVDLSTGHLLDLTFLEGLNNRFKALQPSIKPVMISLNYGDWINFMPYLDLSGSILSNINEGELIKSLHTNSLDVKRSIFDPQ